MKLIPMDGWILISLLTTCGFQINCLKYFICIKKDRKDGVFFFFMLFSESWVVHTWQNWSPAVIRRAHLWSSSILRENGLKQGELLFENVYHVVTKLFAEVQHHIPRLTWMGHIIYPVGWQWNYVAFFDFLIFYCLNTWNYISYVYGYTLHKTNDP